MKILLVAGDNKIQWARLQSTSYRGAAAGLHTSPHILPQYNLLLQWCNCNKAGTILSWLQIENHFIIIIKDRSHEKNNSGVLLMGTFPEGQLKGFFFTNCITNTLLLR